MNILFYYDITINVRHGGIAHVTYFLGKYFEKKGMKVFFLSAHETLPSQMDYQYYLPDSSKLHSKNNKCFFLQFLSEKNIQIIINQNGTSPHRNEILIWTKETNVPVITVLHSSLFGLYGLSNHLQKYQSLIYALKISKPIEKMLRKFFKMKYGKFYRQQIEISKKVVLLSDKFIPEMEYFSGKISDNVISIPNPVTICFPEKISTDKNKEVLFVGRFASEKRIDLLLRIWSKLYKKFPDWRLTLVGNGKKREDMEELAKRLNLERVFFEGFQSPEKYYERAAIFCMTSAFEGFGLVLVEAMANGTVPLAFESYPNVGDIIDNNINGYLVPPFFIEEYACKLSTLMENEALRKQMAKKAKEKSRVFYIDHIAKEWYNLFSELAFC